MSSASIEFWFEFASTYSYPAALRIEAEAARRGRSVSWRPFLLGPIFREQGWDDSPFNLHSKKGRYMWRDLERICAALELPFKKPSRFPRKGLLAARVACAARDEPWLPEFARRVYLANFAEDREIAEPDVVAECLVGLAQDPRAALEAASDAAVKRALRANTERASSLGIFGAPSFVIGGELFWGNDRLEAALDYFGGQLPAQKPS